MATLKSRIVNLITQSQSNREQSAPGSVAMDDAVSRAGSDASRFAPLRAQSIAASESGAGRTRFGGGLSQSMARAAEPGNSFASTLGDSTRIARARQGVMNRGDKALKNQQLVDRIRSVRDGNRIRGQGIDLLGRAKNIRQGVDVSSQAARDFASTSKANAIGGAIGMGTAGLFGTGGMYEDVGKSLQTGLRGAVSGGLSKIGGLFKG